MRESNTIKKNVQEYYGKTLQGNQDLKTSACCTIDAFPKHHKEILGQIDEEILTKFYGCGSPIPLDIEGKTILDLGCGTGRDVYLASKLVGERGKVIGVDMTEEQLSVALRHVDSQMKKFGFTKPNVVFKQGYIESLRELGIEDDSIDVVTSNCVINLSPNKEAVFSEIFRILKPGGELYFSDIFAAQRIPNALKSDPLLRGECLSGALYLEDFRRLLREIGCLDYRIISKSKLEIEDAEVAQKIGMIDFYSVTIRAFKLDSLEDLCEDYGQTATYQGTIPESPNSFTLDDHHVFLKGKPELVCGNTASMLHETRFGKHFQIAGDRATHYGLFDCGPAFKKIENEDTTNGEACC